MQLPQYADYWSVKIGCPYRHILYVHCTVYILTNIDCILLYIFLDPFGNNETRWPTCGKWNTTRHLLLKPIFMLLEKIQNSNMIRRSWYLMTVTLPLRDKKKVWCEDCWASYPHSNSGLTPALLETSSWIVGRLSDSDPSAFKSYTSRLLGALLYVWHFPIIQASGRQGQRGWDSNPGGDKNSN